MHVNDVRKARHLRVLAHALRESVAGLNFDMRVLQRRTKWPTWTRHFGACHTVACALGTGPYAGIEPEFVASGVSGAWLGYAYRNLVMEDEQAGVHAFGWLFASHWALCDNTPEGAALRLMWYRQFGAPEQDQTPTIVADRVVRFNSCYQRPWFAKLVELQLAGIGPSDGWLNEHAAAWLTRGLCQPDHPDEQLLDNKLAEMLRPFPLKKLHAMQETYFDLAQEEMREEAALLAEGG